MKKNSKQVKKLYKLIDEMHIDKKDIIHPKELFSLNDASIENTMTKEDPNTEYREN